MDLFRIFEFTTVVYEVRVSPSSVFCALQNESKEMISTFHLYVATFKQHWHMDYIYISVFDIPGLVVAIMIYWIKGAC
jgi:hypothetical protein